MGYVALVLSLAAHLIIFGLPPPEPLPPTSPEPIEITQLPPPPSSTPHARKRGRRLALGLGGNGGPRVGAYRIGGEIVGSGGGDAPTTENILRDTAVYADVFDRIDQALDYPLAFVAHGEEGMVKARLVFSAEGKFIRGQSSIRSASGFLRVHVIRVLKAAFAEAIRPRNTVLVIRCAFEFRILAAVHGDSGSSVAAGDYLYFYRERDSSPVSFGLSTGPSINLLPLIEKGVDAIGDAIAQRAKRDPLDDYRADPEWVW